MTTRNTTRGSRATSVTRRVDALKARLMFSEDELLVVRSAANAVWNEIGYDCLMSSAEEAPGAGSESITMSRDDVIELVCDAGRLEDRLPPALAARVSAMDYDDLKKLLTPGFAYTRYGL